MERVGAERGDVSQKRVDYITRLMQLSRAWQQSANAVLIAVGVTEASARVLSCLYRLQQPSYSQIANYLGVRVPNVIRLVDGLVESGLVFREKLPTDVRNRSLKVTERGAERVQEAEQCLTRLHERLFAEVTESELQISLEVLQKVQQATVRERFVPPYDL